MKKRLLKSLLNYEKPLLKILYVSKMFAFHSHNPLDLAFHIYKFNKKITNILKIKRSQISTWVLLPSISSSIVKIYTLK